MQRIWTADDGTSVLIRPITPQDLSLTKEFDEHLSPETKYRRLFSDRRLSSDELKRFTDIDARREIALIATTGDAGSVKEIGVARCVDDETGESAEFAIVVSDAWQRRGLGAVLMSALIDAARARGLRRLEAITMTDNHGMQNLARRMGFSSHPEPGEPNLVRLVLPLA